MPDPNQATIYHLSPGVTWIVRDPGVLVIDELARCAETLSYPEAAVWELLCRGHRWDKVISLLTAVLGVAEEEARARAERCLHEWQTKGWMRAIKSADDPQP